MTGDSTAPPGFVLAPFRGLRFDAELVGDLGTVVSPPYDVLDADTVHDLEAANRRNIVRLILSRRFERPYLAVRERLHRWRDQGYLRADPQPALYLYEYVVAGAAVRGLVGLVGLREEAARVILPHEDVMPGPVEDRVVLMRTTGSNLEPILLVHDGSAELRQITAAASHTPPVASFSALDGSRHRLWSLDSPALLDRVAGALVDTRALIADGHHRYAAYLRLQSELRGAGVRPGGSPWDYGLALLVDEGDSALTVGPIHRTVDALTLSDLDEVAAERGDSLVSASRAAADEALAQPPDPDRTRFVVSDGVRWAILETARTHPVDAAVLHETLFPAWRVSEEQVGYHHGIEQALHGIAGQPGVLVALHAPTLAQVMDSAGRGVRMPRKSTSFAPKPRMGVVMRDLADASPDPAPGQHLDLEPGLHAGLAGEEPAS